MTLLVAKPLSIEEMLPYSFSVLQDVPHVPRACYLSLCSPYRHLRRLRCWRQIRPMRLLDYLPAPNLYPSVSSAWLSPEASLAVYALAFVVISEDPHETLFERDMWFSHIATPCPKRF